MATGINIEFDIEDLKVRTGIRDDQLDSRIDDNKLWDLAGHLGSFELYVGKPGFNFNNAKIADLRASAKENGHQCAMREALRKWRNVVHNFTYRSLIQILIKLG